MMSFVLWYIVISLVGWLTVPLAYRLLPALADRGYLFGRTLGWLLWGFLFWLLASLGVVHNDAGGLLLALLGLIALSLWALRGGYLQELTGWLRQHLGMVLQGEVLFLLAFAGWTLVRAANPDIFGTEKPMELAFINAILGSPTFPPHDPWLSGYAISYYYFGYVLVAMLAKLTGTSGGVAFNLGIALVFALSALGAYGIIYNLLAQLRQSGQRVALSLAWLGPFFVLIISNLEGFLEMLHHHGLFWRADANGQLVSPFWRWLDILELNQPPTQPFSWAPRLFGTGNWWWWRASRVVQDYDFSLNPKEIIDEFPFFSYLLADLHPHVLAMPFAFLAMALVLNLFLGGARGRLFTKPFRIPLQIDPPAYLLFAMVLGGLSFLNTWDFPFYVVLFSGAYVLWQMRENDSGMSVRDLLRDFLIAALAVGIGGVVLYLPFYLGFASQARGFLPNLVYPTRGAQLWVMFATLWLPLAAFLFYLWKRTGRWDRLRTAARLVLGLMGVLWVLSLLLPELAATFVPAAGRLLVDNLAAPSFPALMAEAIRRRFANTGGWVTLAILLTFLVALLLPGKENGIGDQENEKRDGSRASLNPQSLSPSSLSLPHAFALLLALLAALLVLFPEFFFLFDQFGWRINTIFKFYYQAWLLWGVAAAYASAVLLSELRRLWGIVYTLGLCLVLLMGLAYPLFGLWDKTSGFRPALGYNLDGTAYIERSVPDDMAAIRWLQAAPPGTIVEAVSYQGGSYSEYARVSMLSGKPGVLGWIGHESQWRGGGREMGSRQADVELLYCTKDWETAQQVLSQYDIRYVFVGTLERLTYIPGNGNCTTGLNQAKFDRYLSPVFQQGQVVVYAVP
jgi:YYY domain-containing protein